MNHEMDNIVKAMKTGGPYINKHHLGYFICSGKDITEVSIKTKNNNEI
jgi:hypothetical protein